MSHLFDSSPLVLPAAAFIGWGTLYGLLGALFAFMCLFLILLILIQKGRGGGLSSAFGGGGGGNTAFGTKTGDLLTWVTSVAFGVFLLLSMGLVWVGDAVHADEQGIRTAPVPADEPILPGDPQSSTAPAPSIPAPAAMPGDDGAPRAGEPTPGQ